MYLATLLEGYSRSFLSRLIQDGFVEVDGRRLKPGYRVRVSERITVRVPPAERPDLVPEEVDFSILYEDDDLLVLSKPPGLVVHPAAGNRTGTLAHGLLHHCDTLPESTEQRPGIVHRLDKDTSGIMLVAKSEKALRKLTEDFRQRRIRKVYHAILLRTPGEESGRITAPVGRHPVNRKKMAVRRESGRFAATGYRVLERFAGNMCLVELVLETGRTHQIRVHMSHIGCPVAGDLLYGGRVAEAQGPRISRQMLHASTLEFVHPVSGKKLSFTAPFYPDMEKVLEILRPLAS
ncbi:MAG: RluA family pseudouridine synthase [Desulfobulbaceae bacterium]